MPWLVLTDTTQQIIRRSKVCSALNPKMRNLSLDPTTSTDFKMPNNDPSSVTPEINDNPNEVIFLGKMIYWLR